MQDAPIHCPADVDATEAEQKACEAVKPDVTTQGQNHPAPTPTPTPTPNPK